MKMIGRSSCCCESGSMRRAMNAYSVISFSVASHSSQQVHRVVADPVLGDHASPVAYVRVVAESEYAGIGYLRWQQGFRPWFSSIPGRPCLLSVSGETVYKDQAGVGKVSEFLPVALSVPSRWRLAKTARQFRSTYSTTLFSPSCINFSPAGKTFREADFVDADDVVCVLLGVDRSSPGSCLREGHDHLGIVVS
jgi:hypothetical protein